MDKPEKQLEALKGYLNDYLYALLKQAIYLMEREMRAPKTGTVIDYGFLVFSGSLVYEGFLKRYLYEMGLISTGHYKSIHFRIGKALNPDLPKRYRNEGWVFEALAGNCGEGVAFELWETWKEARNQVFHYDVGEARPVTLQEAENKLAMILEAMMKAVACERKVKRD